VTGYSYNAQGLLSHRTLPMGQEWQYGYDAANRMTGITDAQSGTTNFTYDAADNLTRFRDANGASTQFSYDVLNRLAQVILPNNATNSYGYDATGNVTSRSDGRGRTTQYTYDTANRLTSVTYADGSVVTYAYDNAGDVTATTGPWGQITYDYSGGYLHDPSTVVISDTNGVPIKTTVTYDYAPPSAGTPLAQSSQLSGNAGQVALTAGLAPTAPPVEQTHAGNDRTTMKAVADTQQLPTNGSWQPISYRPFGQAALDSPSDGLPELAAPKASGTTVPSGTITTTTTWSLSGSPYVVQGRLTIGGGTTPVTLTIDPGVEVRFAANTEIDLWDLGSLVAQGTATRPITFTSNAATPAPGDWNYLYFAAGSTGRLAHCDVSGAGYDGAPALIISSDVQIEDCRIHHNKDEGISLGGTISPTIRNTTIDHNGSFAVTQDTIDMNPTYQGLTMSGNGTDGVVIAGDGVLDRNVTLDGSSAALGGAPIYLMGGSAVAAGTILTITPGSELRFGPILGNLQVYDSGTLTALGTTTHPITFTSYAAIQVPTDRWYGLSFAAGSTVRLAYCDVSGAGAWASVVSDPALDILSSDVQIEDCRIHHNKDAGIALSGTISPTIRNTTIDRNSGRGISVIGGGQTKTSIQASRILHNGGDGVYVSDSTVTISDSTIDGNQGYGVNNDSGTPVVMAENNWWGSSSGPYNPTLNPSGEGDKVSDGVDFRPWKRISRLRYGLNVQTNNAAPLTVRYTYNALNLVNRETSQSPTAFTYNFTYSPNYRITGRGPATGSPGVSTTVSYNANAWGVRLTHRSPDGSVTFADRTYSYDDDGNISSITDANGTTSYAYDSLYRLTQVTYPGGASETYTYDAGGNRLSRGATTYTYDSANRLVSSTADGGTTYTYDANGNLTGKTAGGQTTTYTWNDQNQLARIDYPDGTHSAYTYDHRGRRLSKTDRAGVTIYFVYDGANLVQEVDAAGNVIAQYVYERGLDSPLSMTRNGTTYYYLSDHLGSIIGLTDGGGNLVASYTYDPWGNVISQTGTITNPFRFIGREYDAESGLYFLRARYYDPALGRFLSPDSLRLMGNGASYAYAANNPVNFIDPLGLVQWGRLGMSTLGMVGGGVESVTGVALILAPEPTGLTKVGGVLLTAKGAGDLGLSTANAWGALMEDKADIPTGTFDAIAMGGSRLAGASKKTERTVRGVAAAADLATGLVTGRLAPTNDVLSAANYSMKTTAVINTVGDVSSGFQAATSTGESVVSTYNQVTK